jgi:peptidoglycan/xylan/chitin deacetylase (PgdA/CDA1 family)
MKGITFLGDRIMKSKRENQVHRGKKIGKKEGGVITLSLISIFFIAFFISGIIYKNANITVSTNVTKDIKPIHEKKLRDIENDKLIAAFEKKEHKILMQEQKELLNEKRAKVAKEKAAEEAAMTASATKTNPMHVQDGSKVAYLTFDDGPSTTVTPRILDVLKQYNVKATFFVIGKMAENNAFLVKRESSEGHVVANHTYSHNYDYIYADTKNLVDDFNKSEVLLKSILTEYNSKLVRFPGGAMGSAREAFRQATIKAGYHYIDWNALNNDSDARYIPKGTYCAPVSVLVNSIKETCAGKQKVVVLMHDAPAKTTTADALPQVIEYLISQGYVFKTLD